MRETGNKKRAHNNARPTTMATKIEWSLLLLCVCVCVVATKLTCSLCVCALNGTQVHSDETMYTCNKDMRMRPKSPQPFFTQKKLRDSYNGHTFHIQCEPKHFKMIGCIDIKIIIIVVVHASHQPIKSKTSKSQPREDTEHRKPKANRLKYTTN